MYIRSFNKAVISCLVLAVLHDGGLHDLILRVAPDPALDHYTRHFDWLVVVRSEKDNIITGVPRKLLFVLHSRE
jgi:hypothetical protein